MMYGFDMWGGGWWMILLWIVVVVIAIWAVRSLFSSAPQQQHQKSAQSPLEIAKARYARGEISREEYLTLLEDLKEGQ